MASYNVILSGGAGFIGSHLGERLIALGHKVLVVDDLSFGNTSNLPIKSEFICEDITEYKFKKQVDYVFHLAAIASVPISIKEPERTYNVNVNGTQNMLKEAGRWKAKKFIFASSCAVYGDIKTTATEITATNPMSPYAKHKLQGEKLCEESGVPYAILRFSNVYGDRMEGSTEDSLLIAKAKECLKTDTSLPVYGDGTNVRDFIHVSDVVEACIVAMKQGRSPLNITTGKGTSVNEIVKLIGCKSHYEKERKGDPRWFIGDNTNAKAVLGWNPKVEIKEGIKLI